jgi:hypothetical protein
MMDRHTRRSLHLWVALWVLAGSVSPAAIIMRHDRRDAQYQALAAKYKAVCAVGRAGESTLIAPQWVMTAAHVATGFRRELGVTCGTTVYEVAAIVPHREWRDGGPHDIALIRLSRPVDGIEPLGIYDRSDEAGQPVTFVGRGDHGTGLTGPVGADRVLRAATNQVDAVDEHWLHFTFDGPPRGTELEGISGPGDSGGPALIERDGQPLVAGVSVWGRSGEKGRGTYGAKEGYTRVARYRAWIEETIKP